MLPRPIGLVPSLLLAVGWFTSPPAIGPGCAAASESAATRPPHVIVLIADDISWNDFGCYGNPAARTPHIDALAKTGLLFENAYLTASSCSPSRSSMITGRYPHNNGPAAELHRPISAHIPWFPELLRQTGYYTALSGKNHMTSVKPGPGETPRPPAFDQIDNGRGAGNSGGHANWVEVLRERPADRPFFGWFAAFDAHRDWDADQQWVEAEYGPMHAPEDVIVPPFLVDDADTRRDLASYHNEVTRFDHFVGEVVAELKRQGEFERTLLLVLSDNGRPFPRAKTRLHDSGMKTPLIAHWPESIAAGQRTTSLVSVIDLAPTILEIGGCQIPETVQGVSLRPLLADPSAVVRRYAFSEHNWHDYEAHGRSVRRGDYLLLRNQRPELAWQGPADSVRSPSHQRLLAVRDAGQLTPPQADVFLVPRPEIELYQVIEDPHQLTNLAGQAATREVQDELLAVLTRWSRQTADSVPDVLTPDTFDRHSGEAIRPVPTAADAVTPGQDRGADRVNHPGPR